MIKKYKIIISTVLILIAIIYIPNIYINHQNSKINNKKLPTKFKSYKTIDSLASTTKYISKYTSIYSVKIYPVSDSIVAFSIVKKDKSTTWYKLNIITGSKDSIHFKNKQIKYDNTYLFNDFEGNYNSWLIDGDTINKKIISLDTKGEMKKEEIDIQLKNSDWARWVSDRGTGMLIFHKNKEWREIYVKEYYSIDEFYHNETIHFDRLDEFQTRESKFVYFQSDKIPQSTFWSDNFNLRGWGSSNGGSREHPSYRGQAYFNIKINNKLIKVKSNYADYYIKGKRCNTSLKMSSINSNKVLLMKDSQSIYVINP